MQTLQNTTKPRNIGGRPRKFNEASRPITVTLPDRTLNLLATVDRDRARAIAKATDWITRATEESGAPVEIVEVEEGRSIIVVGPSRCLQEISWLRLVEIAPARFLLVLPVGTPVEALEIAVMDKLEALGQDDEYERNIISQLRGYLTHQRRQDRVSKAELLLIDTSGN